VSAITRRLGRESSAPDPAATGRVAGGARGVELPVGLRIDSRHAGAYEAAFAAASAQV